MSVESDMDNLKFVVVMEEDSNKKLVVSGSSLIGLANDFEQGNGSVTGDAAANGTAIQTIALADGETLYLTKLGMSCDRAGMVKIATGTALDGTQTDLDSYYFSGAGHISITSDGQVPLLKITNSTGSSLNVYLYAPGTALGITCNSVNHHYEANYGGIRQ